MAIPDYNEILERILARVSDEYDKREGSPVYIALAPAAFEMQRVYALASGTEDNAFADTADYYYLQRRAAERGLTPYPATNAIVKGEFNIDVDIGARFSVLNSTVNYYVAEKREDEEHSYNMACETTGETGNISAAELVPIQEIEGLTSAKITGVVVNGEDMESEDDFRERYFSSITDQSFGGNKAAYKEYVNSINGVGACKIYPCYNGGGTVKVTIMDTEMGAASIDLVKAVQDSIDPIDRGSESALNTRKADDLTPPDGVGVEDDDKLPQDNPPEKPDFVFGWDDNAEYMQMKVDGVTNAERFKSVFGENLRSYCLRLIPMGANGRVLEIPFTIDVDCAGACSLLVICYEYNGRYHKGQLFNSDGTSAIGDVIDNTNKSNLCVATRYLSGNWSNVVAVEEFDLGELTAGEYVFKITSPASNTNSIYSIGFLLGSKPAIYGGGLGSGWAPIGHSVYVDTVTVDGITITVDKAGLVWEDGAEDNELTKEKTETAIGEYFSELTNEWAEDDNDDPIVIRVSQIKKRLLDTPALEDIGTVKINGSEANLILSNAHIPSYSALIVEE